LEISSPFFYEKRKAEKKKRKRAFFLRFSFFRPFFEEKRETFGWGQDRIAGKKRSFFGGRDRKGTVKNF
jgi:hypothetical protein